MDGYISVVAGHFKGNQVGGRRLCLLIVVSLGNGLRTIMPRRALVWRAFVGVDCSQGKASRRVNAAPAAVHTLVRHREEDLSIIR